MEEAIYLESVVLMRLLKAAIGREQEILVEVSQSEKLEKIFPLLIPKNSHSSWPESITRSFSTSFTIWR
ncbi:MAG: hypothetical protein ACLTDX_11310 [[Clostridium] innocuum]